MRASFIDLAISAQGYGDEPAFDHRAHMTRTTVIKPHSGAEMLEMLAAYTRTHRSVRHIRIFSHAYPRGVIMTNMSGFYHSPGLDDTELAAYVGNRGQRSEVGGQRPEVRGWRSETGSRTQWDSPRATSHPNILAAAVAEGRIVFAPNCSIHLFGCNLTSGGFTQKLSGAIGGVVIAATAGVYPEIAGGRETGIFIAVTRWQKFANGHLAVPNLGRRWRAW
jgi:hypothetical protein